MHLIIQPQRHRDRKGTEMTSVPSNCLQSQLVILSAVILDRHTVSRDFPKRHVHDFQDEFNILHCNEIPICLCFPSSCSPPSRHREQLTAPYHMAAGSLKITSQPLVQVKANPSLSILC